ncbi:MAG: EamA family transporter, partial [Leucothrix sp.]
CAGLLAHYCITSALQLAPAVIVSPMDFLRLPVMVFIGAIFYNEPFNIWIIVGALLIFLANFWNVWEESRQKTI